MVEQRFRKPLAGSSNLPVGSPFNLRPAPPRYVQNKGGSNPGAVKSGPCGCQPLLSRSECGRPSSGRRTRWAARTAVRGAMTGRSGPFPAWDPLGPWRGALGTAQPGLLHALVDLVGRWYKGLTDNRLRRGPSATRPPSRTPTGSHRNENPRPSVWHTPADEIIAKVRRGRAALAQLNSPTDH